VNAVPGRQLVVQSANVAHINKSPS